LQVTFTACCCAGIHLMSSPELKPIEKLKLKLTTISQVELRLPDIS